ncbi:MAG: Por secretion system C-terminal sorting protein [Bacteroidetes bacterium]|nr:Por secretion system C-terminal sorting protein [Bacteroidota bacterium]
MDRNNVIAVFFFLSLTPFVRLEAQTRDSVFYVNFVYHSDGSLCTHKAPAATFVCYLKGDQGRVLTENASRWSPTNDPNIDGKGTFGVELGNFFGPSLKVGDSVYIRFTCSARGEQAVLSDSIGGIPLQRFPLFLNLIRKYIPPQPQNARLSLNSQKHRVLQWDSVASLTYSVYRRAFSDTLSNGKPRTLYERIARNLTTAAYVDTTTYPSYYHGYIVFAILNGGDYSVASSEVSEPDTISFSLSAVPRGTTAVISWHPYPGLHQVIKGYTIYRRSENGSYDQPVGYCGLDSMFVDSRLPLGTKLFYKVKGRVEATKEIGESSEIAVTTLNSRDGLYTYANLKVAVVIYRNTNRGSLSDADVVKIRTMLEAGRLFYWRNSGMKLNTPFSYHLIDALKNFPNRSDYAVNQTASDLQALGVMNTQYDIVFRISPATSGYWSFGVLNLNLPGPNRSTGFSHSEWPVGTGVSFPVYRTGINFGLTWIFIHEVQHALDALYDVNGEPEMYHGDQPSEFPVASGEHLDFQAKMLRAFNSYERLLPQWGGIYEAVDADKDGFPDNDSLVPLDEARFGSSSSSADTDGDGYSDRQEALDGIYGGSDPKNTDTDGDGIRDGDDPYPRYPVNTVIPFFTPTLDGVIESGWHLANDTVSYCPVGYEPMLYLNHDENFLYVALRLNNIGLPQLQFDFQGDGWWWGSGNTILSISPSQGRFTEFRSWDASPEVRAYARTLNQFGGMWDDEASYQGRFTRRVIDPTSVTLKVNFSFPEAQIEMAIPKSNYAGLTLAAGSKIGLNITYSNAKSISEFWASTFDRYSFVNFVVDKLVSVDEKLARERTTSKFALEQNYPNPFNPSTEISFQLPVRSLVTLKIFDVLGREIATLINGEKSAGSHTIEWNAASMSSGVYFYQLRAHQTDGGQAGNFVATKQLTLLR